MIRCEAGFGAEFLTDAEAPVQGANGYRQIRELPPGTTLVALYQGEVYTYTT